MSVRKPRVLCADDDADIRLILDFGLRLLGGFDVLLCSGGEEALRAAPAFGPDLILLDVMMPGMSGPDTLRALRSIETLRRVPIVFLTAKATADELEGLLEHGATGVIVKPFDPNRLPADLGIYLDYGRLSTSG